jgi:hypothetical protein
MSFYQFLFWNGGVWGQETGKLNKRPWGGLVSFNGLSRDRVRFQSDQLVIHPGMIQAACFERIIAWLQKPCKQGF